MSYYELRRYELLGDRQRKPRRCDVERWAAQERSRTRRRARMVAAANRIWRVFA
jgi:predicted secreted protein